MRRNIVIPIVGGVVAALVLVAALLALGHRHKTTNITITSPSPTVTVVPSPTPSASAPATPTASATASAAASGTAKPGATPAPTAHPTRAVSSVNCKNASDKKYCSQIDGAVRSNGKLTAAPTNKGSTTGPDQATITMKSTIQKGDKSTASVGDEATYIHVEVTVENKTSKTFRFPQREIILEIVKDGSHLSTLSTHGAGFDMAPGTKMTGTFDQKIQSDGTYNWQAKTWYYVK